jgi:hypothetical protein
MLLILGNKEANWCDENTRIVSELFVDEVNNENRDTTHLSKTGYTNVITRFKDRTGLLYSRKQLKNKWDKLKVDYTIWKQLTKQTGLGWSSSGKDIVMTEAWWKETSKVCG